MMRQFTPPGLHLSGPRLPMGMSLIYYDAQNGITVRKRPKQTKPAVKMNSEHRKKLKMTLFSPKTVKGSPMQLHFPQGPDGSSSFSEVKMAENTSVGSATCSSRSRMLRIPKIDQKNFVQKGFVFKKL
jgi:hypothetical protein